MKKILFLLTALAATSIMSAQDETATQEGYTKGDTFITGSIGFSADKNDEVKTTQITIAPSVGYFVTENIAVGAGLAYSHQWEKYTGFATRGGRNTYTPSVFGRYYFTPANKFSLFLHAEAGYTYSEYRSNGDVSHDTDTFNALAGGGINYFITPHLALQSTIGILQYNSYRHTSSTHVDRGNAFSAGLALGNIQFGLAYKF